MYYPLKSFMRIENIGEVKVQNIGGGGGDNGGGGKLFAGSKLIGNPPPSPISAK